MSRPPWRAFWRELLITLGAAAGFVLTSARWPL